MVTLARVVVVEGVWVRMVEVAVEVAGLTMTVVTSMKTLEMRVEGTTEVSVS